MGLVTPSFGDPMRTSLIRTAIVALCLGTSAALILVAAGKPAAAQTRQATMAPPGTFELSPLARGGWVVLDTRTGAMELWTPQQRGFEVHQLGFAEPHARLRVVYTVH